MIVDLLDVKNVLRCTFITLLTAFVQPVLLEGKRVLEVLTGAESGVGTTTNRNLSGRSLWQCVIQWSLYLYTGWGKCHSSGESCGQGIPPPLPHLPVSTDERQHSTAQEVQHPTGHEGAAWAASGEGRGKGSVLRPWGEQSQPQEGVSTEKHVSQSHRKHHIQDLHYLNPLLNDCLHYPNLFLFLPAFLEIGFFSKFPVNSWYKLM